MDKLKLFLKKNQSIIFWSCVAAVSLVMFYFIKWLTIPIIASLFVLVIGFFIFKMSESWCGGSDKDKKKEGIVISAITIAMVVFIWSIFFWVSPASAKETYGPFEVKVVRVVDSDTIKFVKDDWPVIFKETSIRVLGVDTPEKRGTGCRSVYAPNKVPDHIKLVENALGKNATAFVSSLIKPGDKIVISDVQLGKYAGRVVGKVKIKDGRDLSTILIEKGFAVEYYGGTKAGPWCK